MNFNRGKEARSSVCHCEERSDEAFQLDCFGRLRRPRNDKPRGREQRSEKAIAVVAPDSGDAAPAGFFASLRMTTGSSFPSLSSVKIPSFGVVAVAALFFSGVAYSAPASPLADAVEKKDAAAVRALIRDTNVNAAQADGTTALHWAAYNDDPTTAKLLLAAG